MSSSVLVWFCRIFVSPVCVLYLRLCNFRFFFNFICFKQWMLLFECMYLIIDSICHYVLICTSEQKALIKEQSCGLLVGFSRNFLNLIFQNGCLFFDQNEKFMNFVFVLSFLFLFLLLVFFDSVSLIIKSSIYHIFLYYLIDCVYLYLVKCLGNALQSWGRL